MKYDDIYVIYNDDDTKQSVAMGNSITNASQTLLYQTRLTRQLDNFEWTPFMETAYTKDKIKVREGGYSPDNLQEIEVTKIGTMVLNDCRYGIGVTDFS